MHQAIFGAIAFVLGFNAGAVFVIGAPALGAGRADRAGGGPAQAGGFEWR
jgi:hypothetical protein